MQLPMYQSNDEETLQRYRQQLLKERLASLEAEKKEIERQ